MGAANYHPRMDISPKLLRDVEFREQRRGYSPSEVDDFLERLAVGVGQLQQQVKEAGERAEEADRRSAAGSPGEDGIKRTLVLAQRTADAALEEARQQAAVTVADADERAAQVVAGAEERAATTEQAAADRAATVVSQAEDRVATELVPLLSQRDALQQDVEALQAWASEVRAHLAAGLRQQLAWLEGGGGELPPAPEVVDLELPALEGTASGPDGRGPSGSDERGPSGSGDVLQPDTDGVLQPDTDGVGDPDATGVTGAPDERDRPERVDHGDHGVEGGPLATAAADDPFLAELRRAVTDEEPLGPRDPVEADAAGGAADEDDLASSMFRRKKRR